MYRLDHSFFYIKVFGSDLLKINPERSYINLGFNSTVAEFSVLGEFHILRANRWHGYYQKVTIVFFGGITLTYTSIIRPHGIHKKRKRARF